MIPDRIIADSSAVFFSSDTLFKEDFSLRTFTERFAELQKKSQDGNLVLSYQCEDEGEHDLPHA